MLLTAPIVDARGASVESLGEYRVFGPSSVLLPLTVSIDDALDTFFQPTMFASLTRKFSSYVLGWNGLLLLFFYVLTNLLTHKLFPSFGSAWRELS